MNRESQLMIQGGYKSVQFQGPSIRSTSALSSTKLHEEAAIKYGDFPLVQNMVTFQKARYVRLVCGTLMCVEFNILARLDFNSEQQRWRMTETNKYFTQKVRMVGSGHFWS